MQKVEHTKSFYKTHYVIKNRILVKYLLTANVNQNVNINTIMAILRGGRRIGNYDIRIGMPRDKSLVDVAKDPRLQRKPGGSGVIQRFQAQINQGEGMARPNRVYCHY